MNVHNLLHLRLTVERGGPLWANSCFLFEGENAHLDEQIQGTSNIVMTVCWLLFGLFICWDGDLF